MPDKKTKPHYLGHRKRVKEKFLLQDPEHLSDYELLEILLFSTHPRKDTKETAKNLITKYSNIKNLINSDIERLKQDKQINQNSLILIKIIREIIKRNFWQNTQNKCIFKNYDDLLKYCKNSFLNLKYEEFRILFLDKKQHLIEDYKFEEGLIDMINININKIVKKTILLGAKSVILTHNHPSNDVRPSKNDIITTENIIKALRTINIDVKDHIIIGSNSKYYSFRENGLI